MNRSTTRFLSTLAVASSLLAAPVAFAQDRTLRDGVYTEAQAKAGETVY